MPINRTYMCPECGNRLEVVLSSDQWDDPPPSCMVCDAHEMNQEFRPPAIGGSNMSRAAAITEGIMATDYNVANFTSDRREGGQAKVRYKDQTEVTPAVWQASRQMLEQAISIGKGNRREFGLDGLDILKRNLASGAQPDLIEQSKRRSIKVW